MYLLKTLQLTIMASGLQSKQSLNLFSQKPKKFKANENLIEESFIIQQKHKIKPKNEK